MDINRHTHLFFKYVHVCVSAKPGEGGGIDVRSADETSRSSTSSQPPAPLEDSIVTNQSKDLLISGIRK